jgi:mediator of RNA polymerase II transcription subunit 1
LNSFLDLIIVILEKKLGYSATICIESSSSHRLQHESLINTLKTPEGKNLPQFSALTNLNSTQLPACFVLKLQKPLPTSIDILRKITAVTAIEFNYDLINKREPLISLIAKQLFSSQTSSTPFYVKLPNQQHCYHLNESCDKLNGVVITSIPITHPTHVPRILVHLRQQVLFNVIIGSFIRQTSKPGIKLSNVFKSLINCFIN